MSLPRYPKYKDSGVEWLGEVPEGWVVGGLGYRYRIELGKMLDAKQISGRQLAPYLRNVDVQWGLIRTSDLPEMDFDDDDRKRFKVEVGDLLVCEGGEVGRCAVWVGAVDECFYQKALHRVRPYQSARDVTRFLFWTLHWAVKSGCLSADGANATIAHLPAEAFRKYRFPFPPPTEQTAIAAFLDREMAQIDALVAEQERLIELLREKRQAVISHAVTKGLNPNAPMKDSGVEWLGEVPAHWELVRLGKRIELQRGVDITKGVQRPGNVPVISSGGQSSFHDTAIVHGPGVVVGRKGTAGSVHWVDEPFWPHDTTLYVKTFGGNHERFVYYKLLSMDLPSFDTGSSNPTLNRNVVHPVLGPWPSQVEQAEIAVWLDDRTAKLDLLTHESQRAIDLLHERRTALISAAVTGQIDVRGALSQVSL